MREYSIADARNDLPSIVHDVERGEPVRLTRHGRPVAVILSKAEFERLSKNREPTDFVSLLDAWRDSVDFEASGITGNEFDNVRDRSTDNVRPPLW